MFYQSRPHIHVCIIIYILERTFSFSCSAFRLLIPNQLPEGLSLSFEDASHTVNI